MYTIKGLSSSHHSGEMYGFETRLFEIDKIAFVCQTATFEFEEEDMPDGVGEHVFGMLIYVSLGSVREGLRLELLEETNRKISFDKLQNILLKEFPDKEIFLKEYFEKIKKESKVK